MFEDYLQKFKNPFQPIEYQLIEPMEDEVELEIPSHHIGQYRILPATRPAKV